MVQHKSMQ